MFIDDLDAARREVTRLQVELVGAENRLAALEKLAVNGGPDVSEFQGDIDWTKVKAAGYELAFVRVADGDRADKLYSEARVQSMRSAGLIVGTYVFARPGNSANKFRDGAIECAMETYAAWRGGALRVGDLPLVYDWENEALVGLDGPTAATHLIRWLRTYNYLRKHRAILYANLAAINFVVPHMSDSDKTFLASHVLWMADPGLDRPRVPLPFTQALIHQYTWEGSVSGINGNVDINRFLGNKDDLEALRIKE